MTQIERSSRKVISGSGWANPLSHSFYLENSAHLKVYAVDADGVLDQLTLGADYSIDGIGDNNGYDVTIAVPGSWTPDRWVLNVEPPIDQPGDISVGGSFGSKFEEALDRVTNRLQHVADMALRAVKSPLSTDPEELVQDDLVVDPALVQDLEAAVDGATASAVAAAASAVTAEAAADQAVAVAAALPPVAASTMLVDNAAGTMRETKTFAETRALLAVAPQVATRTALKALDTTKDTVAILTETLRAGIFVWRTGNHSARVTADTLEAIFLKADAIATTEGAWVRQFYGPMYPEWFGAVGDNTADDSPEIIAALALLASAAVGGGVLELQAKQYRCASTITASIPLDTSVTLRGLGEGRSALVFDAGVDGLDITIDGSVRNRSGCWRYSDLSLITLSDVAATAATFTGIRTPGIPCFMLYGDRLIAEGVDSTKGWLNGYMHDEVNGARYLYPKWTGKQNIKLGVAMEFKGANSPADILVDTPRITFYGTAIMVEGTVEGIMIKTPMIVSGTTGIRHDTPTIEPQLEVRGGHINANTFCIRMIRAVQSNIEGVLLYEDPVGGTGAWNGIQMENAVDMKIHGCTFHGWNGDNTIHNGLVVGSGSSRTTIYGNTFRGHSGADLLDVGIIFDSGLSGSVREFGNVFDPATVTARYSGGLTNGCREQRQWSNNVLHTLVGGATTENIDIPIPAGVFATDPLDATLVLQSGAQYLVAMFMSQDAATTPTNARFTVTRADGANIVAGSNRFGIAVRG